MLCSPFRAVLCFRQEMALLKPASGHSPENKAKAQHCEFSDCYFLQFSVEHLKIDTIHILIISIISLFQECLVLQ